MNEPGLYRAALLDHYRHPRNFGELDGADVVRRHSNALCGDEVEIGVYYEGDTVREVRFRGRGCSVCIASASLMTDTVRGWPRDEVRRLSAKMLEWFSSGEETQVPEPPRRLQALSAVRQYPARRSCVLLAWEALDEALDVR